MIGEIKTGHGLARIVLTTGVKTLIYNRNSRARELASLMRSNESKRAKSESPGAHSRYRYPGTGDTAYLGLQDSDKIAVVSIPERKADSHHRYAAWSGAGYRGSTALNRFGVYNSK